MGDFHYINWKWYCRESHITYQYVIYDYYIDKNSKSIGESPNHFQFKQAISNTKNLTSFTIYLYEKAIKPC